MTKAERSVAARKAIATMRSKGSLKRKPERPKLELVKREQIKLPKDSRFIPTREIMMKTCVFVLTFSGIGNRRQVDTSSIEAEGVSKDWLNVTKKLIECDELDEINSVYSKARLYVDTRALPFTLKRGIYLLPITLVQEVRDKMVEFRNQIKAPVERMCSRMSTLKREAKQRLGPQYNDDDYWTADQLQEAFRMDWQFLNVDSAQNIEGVSREIYEEQRAKAEAGWHETQETIQQVLRAKMSELTNHLIERLQPNEHGEPKMFKESSLDKFNDFLSTFDARNITNDTQMAVLVNEAKALLKTATPENLRTDESVRQYIQHGFETIQQLLDPMIVNQKHRAITLRSKE